MPGEMQERIARAIWNIRREEEDRCDLELEDMSRRHPVWSEALAAMKAMLVPTDGMHLAGELVPDGIGGCPPSVGRIYRAMLSHEIAAAEEARRD